MSARAQRTVAALALLLLLAGCGGGGTGAYVDPALDASTLRADAIAVAGAVALAGPDDPDTRITYRELMTRIGREVRPDLEWIEGSETWIALGPEETAAVLDSYRATGRIGPQQIELLSVLADRARYVWLARIDLDLESVEHDHRRREALDRVVADVQTRGRRQMSATFDLFDLETRRLVFSMQRERVETNPGRDFEVVPLQQPPTPSELSAAVREELSRRVLPDPPSRVTVLRGLVRDATRALPGTP